MRDSLHFRAFYKELTDEQRERYHGELSMYEQSQWYIDWLEKNCNLGFHSVAKHLYRIEGLVKLLTDQQDWKKIL